MQVSIETTGGLERRMTVAVPAAKITSAVEKKLRDINSTVKVSGFRPGKVPISVVRQRFGKQAFQEITTDVMYSSYRQAVHEEKLRPVGRPHIEPLSVSAGQDLKYVATFEVYPEIELPDEYEIRVADVEITTADLDQILEELRKKKTIWTEVDHAAQRHDRITIDFKGMIDGEVFPGGSRNDFTFVLGGSEITPEFEDQLQGMKKDEEKSFQISFAKDHAQQDLAGKTADFEVTMKKVETGGLPELDDAFVKGLGIEDGNLDTLKKRLKADMDIELARRKKAFDREQVMQCLLESGKFELPESLIRQEIQILRKQGRGAKDTAKAKDAADPPDAALEKEAKRRISIGLIVGEIIHRNKIQLDAQKVDQHINMIASGHPKPEEVIKHYRDDRRGMAAIESLVMEEQVVEWVLGRSRQTPISFTFHEFMNR